MRRALEVKPEYYENGSVKNAWARIRNVAYILLIPMMLVMVIGTALGFNFLDAYTVKRAMPRLVLATIFLALSYDVCRILIEVTNGVGRGVAGLIATPFGGTAGLTLQSIFEPSAGNDVVTIVGGGVLAGVAIAAIGVVSLGILASYLFTAAIALLLIFAILTVRELVIVFLIILGPLAILSWIFPGNDKMWKLWWGTFTKLLMMYPLIVGLLVTGRAFASIVNGAGADGLEGVFVVLVKLTAYIGPFFFIPKAFTFAGSAFGNLAGMINDRGKGIFDRQRKWRGETRKKAMKEKMERVQQRGLVRPGGVVGRTRFGQGLNRATGAGLALRESLKSDDGLRSQFSKANRDAAAKRIHRKEEGHAAEDKNLLAKFANDNFVKAFQLIAVGDEEGARFELEKNGIIGPERDAEIAQAKTLFNTYGSSILGMAATAKAGSKTSYTTGVTEMFDDMDAGLHGDSVLFAEQYNAARGAAERSGRYMLSKISFGEGLALAAANRQINANVRNGGPAMLLDDQANISYVNEETGETVFLPAGMTKADINQRMREKALDAMGTYDWNNIHPTDAKNLVSTLGEDIQTISKRIAANSYADPAEKAKDQRLLGQRVGQLQTVRTNASTMGNGEVQRIVADGFDLIREKSAGGETYSFNVNGKDVHTLTDLIDEIGGGPTSEIVNREGQRQKVRIPEDKVSEDFKAIKRGFDSVGRDAGLTPEQKEMMRQQAAARDAANSQDK